MKKTKGLIEQHIHGAFGIDFMKCSPNELVICAQKLMQNGVTAFFPTIMTDDIDVIKERIETIKEAIPLIRSDASKIVGVHLEGPFINSKKAGIHDKKYILPLDVDLYKKIDDDIIKIVTIAPELDYNGAFFSYLKSKNIKISAGHTQTTDFSSVDQVTHLYNAMTPFHHRNESTVVNALINENIYTELIADSIHVCDEVLKLTFKLKPLEKILLISDALPLAHSDISETIFAGEKIYNKEGRLLSEDGTMAGSSSLLCDIIKNLSDKNILKFEAAINCATSNLEYYHKIENHLTVYWNDSNIINKVEVC